MKTNTILLLLLIPSFAFSQVELFDELIIQLNDQINEANNRHLKEYCEFLSTIDYQRIDEKRLFLQTKEYSDKIVESRSYEPSELTDKEVFYKLTFDAFKLCSTSQDALKHLFNISTELATFITIFEMGTLSKDQFVNPSDYTKMVDIQRDANLVSNEVMVDLNALGNNDAMTWAYSYYKFYPRGRKPQENLFSEENRVTTLTFSMTGDKISSVHWDNETTLFAILKRNLSGENNPAPPPPPPPPPRPSKH